METYKLTIKTCERFAEASTDDTVQVKITGESGNETGWKTLDYFFVNDFESGDVREYTVTDFGLIGEPVIVTFRLVGWNPDRNWLVDHVVLKYKESSYFIPVSRWVEDEDVAIAVGKACLPQNETNDSVKTMRAREIERNRQALEWNDVPESEADLGWGIARYLKAHPIKGLPLVYSKTRGQVDRLNKAGLVLAVNAGINLFQGPAGIDELDDYRKLYLGTGHDDPAFIKDWKLDVEFGRQILNGISPLAFERCAKLPDNCNITEEHCAQMLEDSTLASEMEAGRIYIADYSFAANITRNDIPLTSKKFECANCIGIFHATVDGDFLPLAIQLVPDDAESVFTPADTEYDWLLAKIHFRCVQSNLHEWVYHYLLTHGLSETFSVATFRCFPHCHPIFKLLRPHLASVPYINEAARSVLLPKTALANQALSLSALDTCRYFYRSFDLSMVDIPENLKARGVDDSECLKNYHYRDDAVDVWKAIESYVRKVVTFYYTGDDDVDGDFELQGWASDLANEGLGWQDGNTRGMPESIKTIDELVRICTIIIFASSAQHAAVNFGQMETYQFTPNAPASTVLPPHKRGEGSLKRVLETLPNIATSTILVSFAYALSQYAVDEVYLGNYMEQLFVEEEVKDIQRDFRADLKKLSLKFYKRNNALKYPYWYLLPEKIPCNINI